MLTLVCLRIKSNLSFSGSGNRKLKALVTSSRTFGSSHDLTVPCVSSLPLTRIDRRCDGFASDRLTAALVGWDTGSPSAAAMKASGSKRGRRVRRLATEYLLVEGVDLA